MRSILPTSGESTFGTPMLNMGEMNDTPSHFVKAQPAVEAVTGSRQF